MSAHTIRLSGSEDHTMQFAAWLQAQGHSVTTDSTTGCYVDGSWVIRDDVANTKMCQLWAAFQKEVSYA